MQKGGIAIRRWMVRNRVLIGVLGALMLTTLMIGCGGTSDPTPAQDGESLRSYRLPAMLFEGEDMEMLRQEALEAGMTDVVVHEDGSVTYTMPAALYQELQDSHVRELRIYVEGLEAGEEFPSIQRVEHDEGYSEFTLTVNRSLYEEHHDVFAAYGLSLMGYYHQIFLGTEPEEAEVMVHLQDQDSGEIFDSISFLEVLQ